MSCAIGQTYEINPHDSNSSSTQELSHTPENNPGLGWGSSIEVARQARAAQEALKRSDYAAAVSFAQQATKSAPKSADLWFLLGYAARLDGQYPISLQAYNRGLQLHPDSVNGMAGLAQTYARMGRDADAQQLLQRVIEANPKDANSLELAGEMLLNSDANRALELLRRANALQASAHSDVLIAHAYETLGQPAESARYLDRARNLAPRDEEVLRAVAGQYREQGEYDQAISTLRSIPAKNADVQSELAYTFELAGRKQEAANLYSRLAKAARGNIGLDLSAAQAWVNLGQFDTARSFLDSARQVDNNNYRLHAILATIADGEGRLADASGEYNLALSNLPPRTPEGPLYPIELRLNLYEIALRQNDAEAAKHQLDVSRAEIGRLSVPASSRPEMLRLRAAVEAGSGDLDAANRDLKEALALAPSSVNSLLDYGNLQWKLGQKEAAQATFARALQLDHNNHNALESLGYLARDEGDTKLAQTYFTQAAASNPRDFDAFLALGDLYTAERKFRIAQTDYAKAYERMPGNPLIIAGGANAAMESHRLDLAKRWLDRANGKMSNSPQVDRERERYLTFRGDYAAAAKFGYAVLQKLPRDREGVVYLAYDLYYLSRFDDALTLTQKYDPIFPTDKDLPLIAGYVHVHQQQLPEALNDFSRALQRDPKMATGYVNRGFVLNDLHEGAKAAIDFQTAIRLEPDYGAAHLGLAYSDLQLHRPGSALSQLETTQRLSGKSHAWHLARAEAFRQEQDFSHAEPEYRIALQEQPNDLPTQLAFADALYRMRNFSQSLAALATAQKLSPADPRVYALRAQVHAKQGARADTMGDIQLADKYGSNQVDVLMAEGDALLTLGDRDAAMQRFSRALDIPNGDRIGVRLAIAQVFLRQGSFDDVRRQIALGFAEARMNASPVTAADITEAAAIFLAMHDFDLAETYFDKARLAGANPRDIEIGLANTYLAEGQTRKAAGELASLGPQRDYRDDYDYMMALANLDRQRQKTVQALSAFAQASTVAGQGDQQTAEIAENELLSEEGRQLTPQVSVSPEVSFTPALEDINVYTLDARILHVANPSLLPPPRHSFQSLAESHYRLHLPNLPLISGFVGQSVTTGRLLFPSVNVVQDRNTYDTFFNGGISPVLHLGPNQITFNGGLQFTIRRDTISPVYMSQNLFRQFLYVSTSSFANWVSINGSAVREAGPFIDQDLHSRDAAASLEFNVGRPWGRTSLIAGYTVRDLLFRPMVEEYFNTSTYVGLQHKFGDRFTAAALAEDLRSWEVQGVQYATAEALLPGGRFELRASPHWDVEGSFILSRGMGFHQYDNAQSQFLISYSRPLRHGFKNGLDGTAVKYPFRLSFGLQQQTFYDFAGSMRTTLLPVVHFNLF